MSGLTITTLAQQVQVLLDKTKQQNSNLAAWLGGSATGGPNNDGRYPFVDLSGHEILVPSPASFSDMTSGPAAQASVAKVAAELARDLAQGHADRADAQRILSEAARGAAVEARNLAQQHRSHAGTSEANARYWAELAQGSGQSTSQDREIVEQLAEQVSDDAALATQKATAAEASAALAATFDPNLFDKKSDTLAASRLEGMIDPARIPVLVGQTPVVSTGGIANLTTAQQNGIRPGTLVATMDGRRWVYSGSGAKNVEANYIEQGDVTPVWAVIADKPSFFPSNIVNVAGLQSALDGKSNTGHGHGIADVANLQAALDARALTGHVHAWTTITDRPTIFPTDIANVSGLQAALNGKSSLTGGNSWNGGQTFNGGITVKDSLTMTGADPYLRRDSNSAAWVIAGGQGWTDTGAVIVLHGKNHPARPGDMLLYGVDGNATSNLQMDGWKTITMNRRPTFALHLFPLAYAREEQDRSRPVRVGLVAATVSIQTRHLVEAVRLIAVAAFDRLVQFDQTLRVVGRVDLGVIPHAALREHQNILMLREDAIVLVKVLGLASLRPDHRIAVKVGSRRDQRGRETTLRGHYDIPGRREDAPKLREHLVHRDDLVPRLDRNPIGQVHSNQVHGLVRQLRHRGQTVRVEQRRLDRPTLRRSRRRKRLDGAVQTLRSLGIVARVQFDPDVMASRRASRDARRARSAERIADSVMLRLEVFEDATRQFDRHRRRVVRVDLRSRPDRQHIEKLARRGELELRLRQQIDEFEARVQEVFVGRESRLTMPDDPLAQVRQNVVRDQFFRRQQTALKGLVLVLEENRAVLLEDAPALRQQVMHPRDIIGVGHVVAERGVALGELGVPERTAALIAAGATLVVGRREEEDRDRTRRLGLEPLQRVSGDKASRASLGESRIRNSGETSASDLFVRQIRVSVAAIDVYQAATGRPLVKHFA